MWTALSEIQLPYNFNDWNNDGKFTMADLNSFFESLGKSSKLKKTNIYGYF